MVIDSSALVASILGEPAAAAIDAAILADPRRLMAAPSVLESSLALMARAGADGDRILSSILQQLAITIVPMTADHALLARQAAIRYGKGRHPARLNFGDCISYALAISTGEPLLYVGSDFTQTDVRAVL
jgi:ribonuclease VapC